MQALILAGGLGTRLRSIVNNTPKPMAQLNSKPFLEYQLEFLKHHHITEFIFCVGYLHHAIQDYFEDGARWNVHINYSIEEELVGTGGAIKLAERYQCDSFLVLNGDSFFNIDLTAFIGFHRSHQTQEQGNNYLGSLALTSIDDTRAYGSVQLDSAHNITHFIEKSENGVAPVEEPRLVNAGIYILEPEILHFIPPRQKVSIERETFPAVLQSGYALGGYAADGFFVDIGTPAGYHRFQEYLQEEYA